MKRELIADLIRARLTEAEAEGDEARAWVVTYKKHCGDRYVAWPKIVYRPYGLTEEEIAIVEGTAPEAITKGCEHVGLSPSRGPDANLSRGPRLRARKALTYNKRKIITSTQECIPMQQRLTLRMDEALVRRAKAYARRTGTSVSALVADYFAVLGQSAEDELDLSPTVRSLVGVLADSEIDETDYLDHLAAKHA